jgi:hypothetical protein
VWPTGRTIISLLTKILFGALQLLIIVLELWLRWLLRPCEDTWLLLLNCYNLPMCGLIRMILYLISMNESVRLKAMNFLVWKVSLPIHIGYRIGYVCNFWTDVNECDKGSTCDVNAHCNNTIGGFTCTCKHGYVELLPIGGCTGRPLHAK